MPDKTFLLLGIIFTGAIIAFFLLYKIETDRIIKSQENEIDYLKGVNRRLELKLKAKIKKGC